MSRCTERNQNFLESIHNCKSLKRKKIISSCSSDNIKALSELALNTLKGNLKVKPFQLKQLRKHRTAIRKLSKRNVSEKTKRKLLIQNGGFLPFLIAPFLSAIGAVAGKALAKSLGI
jgi:hypothetical protein